MRDQIGYQWGVSQNRDTIWRKIITIWEKTKRGDRKVALSTQRDSWKTDTGENPRVKEKRKKIVWIFFLFLFFGYQKKTSLFLALGLFDDTRTRPVPNLYGKKSGPPPDQILALSASTPWRIAPSPQREILDLHLQAVKRLALQSRLHDATLCERLNDFLFVRQKTSSLDLTITPQKKLMAHPFVADVAFSLIFLCLLFFQLFLGTLRFTLFFWPVNVFVFSSCLVFSDWEAQSNSTPVIQLWCFGCKMSLGISFLCVMSIFYMYLCIVSVWDGYGFWCTCNGYDLLLAWDVFTLETVGEICYPKRIPIVFL